MIIRIKLTKEKLKQELFYKGAKGTYIDCTLLENKNGTDEYGNDGMIVQDISKEARERGEKGPIVGNFKIVNQNRPSQPAAEQPRGPQPTRSGNTATVMNGNATPPEDVSW